MGPRSCLGKPLAEAKLGLWMGRGWEDEASSCDIGEPFGARYDVFSY